MDVGGGEGFTNTGHGLVPSFVAHQSDAFDVIEMLRFPLDLLSQGPEVPAIEMVHGYEQQDFSIAGNQPLAVEPDLFEVLPAQFAVEIYFQNIAMRELINMVSGLHEQGGIGNQTYVRVSQRVL
jgi:hypothetical protein